MCSTGSTSERCMFLNKNCNTPIAWWLECEMLPRGLSGSSRDFQETLETWWKVLWWIGKQENSYGSKSRRHVKVKVERGEWSERKREVVRRARRRWGAVVVVGRDQEIFVPSALQSSPNSPRLLPPPPSPPSPPPLPLFPASHHFDRRRSEVRGKEGRGRSWLSSVAEECGGEREHAYKRRALPLRCCDVTAETFPPPSLPKLTYWLCYFFLISMALASLLLQQQGVVLVHGRISRLMRPVIWTFVAPA